MHIPSFVVGSVASGSVFLLVHQQLSYRERLTRKWPLAEKAENELRRRLKEMRGQIESQKANVGVIEAPLGRDTVSKYYNQTLDTAYNFFAKKD